MLTAVRRMLEDKTPTLMSRLIKGGTWQADKAFTHSTHTPNTGRRYCQVAEISSITITK
jgi:hypothetical protein